MRILLATAVAIAPLMMASGAMAEVVISTARTTPITTSNATGSGPDDIRIGVGGSLNLVSGTSVTVDTGRNVTIDTGGGINSGPSTDATVGVLVNSGLTSNVLGNGSIVVSDTITTYPDTDLDGDIDGAWATGSDRYGIRYAPGAAVTGNLTLGSVGLISVEGNNSYGISIESGLIGKLQTQGTIRTFGDNSIGVRTQGPITGPVNLLGTIQARGANASGVAIGGDVTGRLTIQGDINATGYRYTARGTTAFELKLDNDDKLQGGPAVIIAGNVAGGGVVDAPPTDADPASLDEDGDGIPDSEENLLGMDSLDPADGALDSDGDGFTNAQEYRMGTDLKDGAGFLRKVVEENGGQFSIRLADTDVLAGRWYIFETSSDLQNWTVADGVRGADVVGDLVFDLPVGTQAFARVRVEWSE